VCDVSCDDCIGPSSKDCIKCADDLYLLKSGQCSPACPTEQVSDADRVCQDAPDFVVKVNRTTPFTFEPAPAAGQPYVVGESYLISPPGFPAFPLMQNGTVVSSGTFSDITFTLDDAFGYTTPPGWFVGTSTGEVFGRCISPCNLSMVLKAKDLRGNTAEVETYTFQVEPKPEFILKTPWDASVINSSGFGLNTQGSIKYEKGKEHAVPAFNASNQALFNFPAGNDFSRIIYAVRVVDATSKTVLPAASGSYFVSQSGEIRLKTLVEGTFVANFTAQDKSGAEIVLYSWRFQVLPNDLPTKDNPDRASNGPNGQDCSNKYVAMLQGEGEKVDVADIRVDIDPLDGAFTCDCSRVGAAGENCEQSDGSREQQLAITATAGSVSGGVVIGLLILAAYRYRAYKIRMRPHNFELQMQARCSFRDRIVVFEKCYVLGLTLVVGFKPGRTCDQIPSLSRVYSTLL
jgi:hypothetical protein